MKCDVKNSGQWHDFSTAPRNGCAFEAGVYESDYGKMTWNTKIVFWKKGWLRWNLVGWPNSYPPMYWRELPLPPGDM